MSDLVKHGLTPADVQALFTRRSGEYVFARWGRPIAPVIFGAADETLPIFKAALQAVVALAGHDMVETDPELGANVMVFAVRSWDELLAVQNLWRLVPNLAALVGRLNAASANQYRLFRFDGSGAIKAAFVFLRFDDHLAEMAAEDIALQQAAQIICLWSDTAFAARPILAGVGGVAVLRDDVAAVIRTAYNPMLPKSATDAAHALRLWARL
jgi:hypothetical protein